MTEKDLKKIAQSRPKIVDAACTLVTAYWSLTIVLLAAYLVGIGVWPVLVILIGMPLLAYTSFLVWEQKERILAPESEKPKFELTVNHKHDISTTEGKVEAQIANHLAKRGMV